MRTNEEKFRTVIDKNTFYFYNKKFEHEYEGYINSLKETLLVLENDIRINGIKKEVFVNLLKNKANGLVSILALTGISNETLKRITTLIRVVDDKELNELVNKKHWLCEEEEDIREWTDNKIHNMVKNNKEFREGIVNLFFEGATIPILSKTIPLFEIKKLSISKLGFKLPEMIDTLIRYKEKGSYSGKKDRNPEIVIEELLKEVGIGYEKGDLNKLILNAYDQKRTMDFIIPNKESPIFIVECSFLATTSSGQGDKSKTEISIGQLLSEHYPTTKFIGFVDGIGWYVRQGDLMRMVGAYDDVFTFHEDELNRFRDIVIERINND